MVKKSLNQPIKDHVVVYEPDNVIRKGRLNIFREIYKDIIDNRGLTFQLLKRNIYGLYKSSFMGIAWAFIIPIISVLTFVFLNMAGIINLGDINLPYAIYAVVGLMFWQIFSTGIVEATNSLVSGGSMIVKINFSKKSLAFASFGRPFISFLVQLILFVILCVWFGFIPSYMICLLILLIIPISLLTLGIGLILSILNSITRDISNFLSVAMSFIMFLTPVLYARPNIGGFLAFFYRFNPLVYLINVPRDLVLFGYSQDIIPFLITSIFSVILFGIALIIFHVAEIRIAERVGG